MASRRKRRLASVRRLLGLLSRHRRTHQAAAAADAGPSRPAPTLHEAMLMPDGTVALGILEASPPPPADLVNRPYLHLELTPLAIAVVRRHERMVRLLLDAGATPNPLTEKPPGGRPGVVVPCLHYPGGAGGTLGTSTTTTTTTTTASSLPLAATATAAVDGEEDSDGDGDASSSDENGGSTSTVTGPFDLPLATAVMNQDMAITRLLLDAGADANSPDHRGVMPLHYAAAGQSRALVVALVGHGADVDARSRRVGSALVWAVDAGNADMVLCLLEQGARLDVPDVDGCLAIHHAAYAKEASVTLALLARGAPVNSPTMSHDENGGSTPLHYAALQSTLEMVRLLVAAGADAAAANTMGETVLYWAAGNKGPDAVPILRYLLELPGRPCGDVNVRHRYGGTPLHMAAWRGVQDTVVFLLRQGADRSVRADNFHFSRLRHVRGTAEAFARKRGHYEVAEVLATWDSGDTPHGV